MKDLHDFTKQHLLQVVMPTVEADVAFGLGKFNLTNDEVKSRVSKALDAVGMSEYIQVRSIYVSKLLKHVENFYMYIFGLYLFSVPYIRDPFKLSVVVRNKGLPLPEPWLKHVKSCY